MSGASPFTVFQKTAENRRIRTGDVDERKKSRRRKIKWALGLLAVALICLWGPGGLGNRYHAMRIREDIRAGRFEEAEFRIRRTGAFELFDREFLLMYCRCYPLYLEGKQDGAAEQYAPYYRYMTTLSGQSWLDWAALDRIAAEKTRLEEEKNAEREARMAVLREQAEREYQEKLRNSEEPWLGMREWDIGKTKLGKWAKKGTETESVQEKESKVYRDPQFVRRTVTHYDFYKNGRIYLEVFCTEGTVDELARYENGKVYYTYSSSLSAYREAWHNRAYVPMTGFYDAGEYASEEDYYEDYADEYEGPDDVPDLT